MLGASAPRASLSPAVTVRLHRFTDLASYLGQQVTVTERDGSASSGTLTRVNEQRLWLEMTMGSGRAEINLREDSVRELMLADGTRLVLDTAGGGETAAAPAPERAAPDEDGAPYQGLIGGPVTVTLESGERHRGTLVDVDKRRVTLAVAMGSGKVEYFYDLGDVASIEEAQ